MLLRNTGSTVIDRLTSAYYPVIAVEVFFVFFLSRTGALREIQYILVFKV